MYRKEELEEIMKCPISENVDNRCLGMKCMAFDSECDGSDIVKYTLELIEVLSKVSEWFENGELIGKDLTFINQLIKKRVIR